MLTTSSPSIVQARARVAALRRGRVKLAELGGGQDMPFEQAFSNLAHAYLKDKAPSLLDYEVGFQLVDRNQENTKAIGVFGFKVGTQWLYGPTFFLNGDLKGHELLYIKNQDMFVPMKENWLNYILNRRPPVLGHSVSRNLQEIGVMPPHLYQLSRSPTKFAADSSAARKLEKLSEWARAPVAAVAYWANTPIKKEPKYEGILDLPSFLKQAGRDVVLALVETFRQYPRVKNAFTQFHDLKVVQDAVEEVRRRDAEAASTSVIKEAARCRMTPNGLRCVEDKPKAAPAKTVLPEGAPENTETGDKLGKIGAVAILTYSDVLHSGDEESIKGLSAEERKKLLRDKVLIKDKRPDHSVSRVYEVQTTLSLRNPDQTGLYDVLVKPGSFEKCLVVMAPASNHRRETFCTVVRLDGGDGKTWLNTHPAHVWVKNQHARAAFEAWVGKLPKADSLAEGEAPYLLINEFGEGSVPVEVTQELGADGGDSKSYGAWFRRYAERKRPNYLPPTDETISHDYFGCSGDSRVVLTGKEGAKLRISDGALYVPDGFRKLKLAKGFGGESKEPPIRPGNMDDIDSLIGQKTAALKVSVDSTEACVNGVRMTKLAALVHLVRDHGLREKQARTVMTRAECDRVVKCRVKYADQYYSQQKSAPGAPGFPEPYVGTDALTGGNVPTMQMSEFNVKVPDMSSAKTDRSVYMPMGPNPDYQQGSKSPPQPDQQAQQLAMQAAQTGQKEIFDTAMIGGLLKAVRDDNLVDRYMGDLMKGMDRLARILFLFYWHNEKFADRYGQAEMVELEDGLRNAFESVGDIVLFLKQRSVDPNPDAVGNPDLGEISNN